MKIRGRVEGLAGFRAGLDRIADEAALAGALAEAADHIRGAARANLEDGESAEGQRSELAASLAVATDGLSVTVGTPLPQGWHLEMGSLARPAAPWLEPVLETARPSILARMRGVFS